MPPPLHIVMAASEAVPYAKTGGLADMVTALSKTLSKLGHQISLFLPLYNSIDKSTLLATGHTLIVPISTQQEKADIFSYRADGITFYFIESTHYFSREGLYGEKGADYPDNAARFVFFSRAVLEASKVLGLQPDIFHCHDWHTALIPVYLKTVYTKDFQKSVSLLTIHNLGYQGAFWHYDWHLLNLSWDYFHHQALEFYGKINFLKGGIVFADALSTVSPKYAKEIQTAAFGGRLEGLLTKRRRQIVGILNGIDTQEWDPARDINIPYRYHPGDLTGKEKCKAALQKELSLSLKKNWPLLAMVSRLSEQKGVDLMLATLSKLMQWDVQLVIMGTGDKRYEAALRKLAETYPGQASIKISYDAALAHRITAGADMFLMPSRYEPCGLSQMMSLRYGTAPIVRAVGGLDNTVAQFNPLTLIGNGFKFREYSDTAFLRQIQKALSLFKERKKWHALIQNGMHGNYGWDLSAEKYTKLYYTMILEKNESVP